MAQTVSSPYLRSMNGTKNDIDPATELVEDDDEQALPEQETWRSTLRLMPGRWRRAGQSSRAMPSTRRPRPASTA